MCRVTFTLPGQPCLHFIIVPRTWTLILKQIVIHLQSLLTRYIYLPPSSITPHHQPGGVCAYVRPWRHWWLYWRCALCQLEYINIVNCAVQGTGSASSTSGADVWHDRLHFNIASVNILESDCSPHSRYTVLLQINTVSLSLIVWTHTNALVYTVYALASPAIPSCHLSYY